MNAHAVPVALWPLGTARLGLDVFFTLSGFLVVQSWNSTRAGAPSTLRALWDYASRRARRILPAYWVMVAILVPIVGRELLAHPERIVAFASLSQGVRFWLPEQLNLVTWSLTTETYFYVLVPLLAWLLRRAGKWPVLAVCVAASVLWWLDPPADLPQSFVFGRLAEFAAGAVAAELYLEHQRERAPAFVAHLGRGTVGVGIAAGILAIGTYHGASLGLSNVPTIDALVHPLVGTLAATGLLHLLLAGHTRVVASRPLQWAGIISFGVYLWHYPIFEYGLGWLRAIAPRPSVAATGTMVALLCGACIAAGTVSYALIERPFIRRRNRAGTAAAAGTLDPWPSRRSSASRPSTASHCEARPIPILSSRRAS